MYKYKHKLFKENENLINEWAEDVFRLFKVSHILFTILVLEKIGGYADEKHGGLILGLL